MEIVIAVFIGGWISLAAVTAYRHLKKEYKSIMEREDK